MGPSNFVPAASSTLPTVFTGSKLDIARGLKWKSRAIAVAAMCLFSAKFVAAQAITLVPTIVPYAGNGTNGFAGDGGQATAAELAQPKGIAYDGRGNTYLADYGNNRIRVVNAQGIISTIAGTGVACANPTAATNACGDNGIASAAQFANPTQIVFDTAGNLYIADYTDNRIRRIAVDPATGIVDGNSIVTTIAGNGTAGTTNNGKAANTAEINRPHGLAFDKAGNLYEAEQSGCVVRKIATPAAATSIITAFAGNGTCGYNNDGGAATASELNAPTDLATDAAGNVYIGDEKNGRVRKVTVGTTNIISTIAGTTFQACAATAPSATVNTPGLCGDGGPATAATLGGPTGVLVDPSGDVIISDGYGARVREISAKTGFISTIAGTGQQCASTATGTGGATTGPNRYPVCGDGGPATSALISFPQVVSINPQGNIQFVDDYDNKVRQILNNIVFPPTNVGSVSAAQNVIVQVNTASTISGVTVPVDAAGTPEFVVGTITGCTVNGTTTNAVGSICTIPVTFNPAYTGLQTQPLVIATSNGTFTFALNGVGLGPQAILLPGVLNTVAGTGTATVGTPATNVVSTTATLNGPFRSSVDVSGNIYIADTKSNVVRIIYNSGASVSALIALENGGVAPTAGNIYTVAGNGTACAAPTATPACGDGGLATAATLNAPTDVSLDTTDGNLVISDSGDNRVRLVNASTGIISTVVGTGAAVGTADGALPTATAVGTPFRTFVDINGGYFVVAKSDNAIRYVPSGSGAVSTIAGITGTACPNPTAATGACGDGGQATAATLNSPSGISVDFNGDIYIADTGDNRIRYITKSTGIITTLAGTGAAGFSGDLGAATNATLNAPTSVYVDAATDVWIADSGNAVIREVLTGTTPANIYTVAGVGVTPCTPATGTCGDGGPANVPAFTTPTGIVLDTAGNILVTDSGANKVRKIVTNPILLPFAATTVASTSADSPKTAYLQNIGNVALTLSKPAAGTNPSISAGFTEGNSQTCPQLTTASAAATLTAGTECSYVISFTPTTVGAYNGSLVQTDNSLYNTASTQVINLTGTSNAVSGALDTVTPATATVTGGTADQLTFAIPVVTGAPVPAGTVVFTANNGTSTVTLGTATFPTVPTTGTCPSGTGTCYLLSPATAPTNYLAGTNTVTATFTSTAASGYASSAPTTTVSSTSAALTSNAPTPDTYGTPVTLTDTIAAIGGACPTVAATFSNGATTLGTGAFTLANGNCVATYGPTAALPVGTDNLTATTPASAPFPATSAPLTITVGQAPVTNTTTPALSDTIAASPNPQTFGSPVSLSFSVLVAMGNAAPGGTVTFSAPVNGTPTTFGTAAVPLAPTAATQVIGGITYTVYTATTTTSALPAGADTVTGTYTGDANYAGGPLTTVEQINASAPPANLTVGPNPSTFGSPVTITETITPVNGACPVGPVTFLSNGASIGTGAIALTGSPASCVATITTSSLPVGSDAITATIPADANFTAILSGPVALVVNKAAAADLLTSNPNPSIVGQTVTLTDTVPTALAGTVPTGTVNFYSYSTLVGTGTLNASGVATITTSTLAQGTDALTAVYQGDANYAQVTSNTVNQVVNPIPTGATLSAAPNPTTFGTLVTVQETIPVVNGIAPTGTVTFFYNGTQIGTGQLTVQGTGANAVAVASTTTSTLPVGTDPLSASYPGDANYAAVNSTGTVTVNKAIGADTLSSSLNPANFGASVTFTDTVPTVGGVAPTGTVTFYDNGTQIGTGTIANGVATYTTTTLTVATHPITATYGGDNNYAQVTSNTVNEVVTNTTPTPALSANPNPAAFGTTVTLSETIPGINGVAPTGTVQFFYNGTAIGTGTVTNGVATTTTSTLPIGTDPVTATYSGDTNYATANSSTNVTITKSALPDTVVASPNPSTFGSSVTLTFTVPVVNGVAPTGTVQFFNGTTSLGTGNVSTLGIATLATTALPVGSDAITAQYPGDNTYTAQNPTTTAVVNAAAPTAGLMANPNPGTFGTPVTLTETIVPINGTCPVGPVTFLNSGASIGTGVITLTGSPASCVATITTSALPAGNNPVTATVPASNGFTAINSAAIVPIAKVPFGGNGDTLATSNPTPQLGQAVTLTFTVATVNGVAPTGTVQFYNGTTLLGTGTLNAQGIATLTTTSLPTGTTTVNATYSGDASYTGGTLNVVERIVVNDFSIAATPASQVINPGETAVYTVSLSGVGGPFTSPVTLSATGLPADATVSFGTVTYVPGVGPTPTTMTIVTSPKHAMLDPGLPGAKVFYGLLLLPLLCSGRLRRKIRTLPKGVVYGLAALLMLGGLGAITGCAGGYVGPAPAQYTITVTGTSGTLVHSTTVTLTVR